MSLTTSLRSYPVYKAPPSPKQNTESVTNPHTNAGPALSLFDAPVRSSHTALKVISSQNAFIKIVSAPPDSDRCLDYFIKQVANPNNFRPLKTIGDDVHRHIVLDPKNGDWQYRPSAYNAVRGAPKDTPFTKKTDVYLAPADFVITPFMPKHGHPVLIGFHAGLCHLKDEKYIFKQDANTDGKPWLQRKDGIDTQPKMPERISLNELRQHLAAVRAQGIVPEWNNVLAGVSKKGLSFVGAYSEKIEDKIKAIYTKQKVFDELGLAVPILVRTQNGVSVYEEHMQQDDLSFILQNGNALFSREYIENIVVKFSQPAKIQVNYIR